MAAAEARAVWQRTANRCFVQEDAKRAPKLACCQSSSATLKQADAMGYTVPAGEGPGHAAVGISSLNRNAPPNSNLSPDTRWWLQKQPDYGYRKGFTFEQINALGNEDVPARAGVLSSTSIVSESHKRKGDMDDRSAKKKTGDLMAIEELVGIEDSMEGWEMMEMGSIDHSDAKIPSDTCFDPEYSWVGNVRSEPWWRKIDRDELVSLVARKSLDHVENCDLPPPQKIFHRTTMYARAGRFNINASRGFTISDDTLSNTNTAEIQKECKGEFSKAQLMEALCHSQTRAREAEKAAKKACAEKDHIVTLFFRQASVLFAYKQWFRLLQLESLYVQFKKKNNNNDEDKKISTLFPLELPWISADSIDRRSRKSLHEGLKSDEGERREQPSHGMTKYTMAFALGLSLVGAGLLLGWTVGWMLPRF